MRRRTALVLAALVATGLLSATPVAAIDEGDTHGTTYLALGDSIPAGTQQPDVFTKRGYANRLFRDLVDDYGFEKLVNLACPGDDSMEMIDGIGGASEFGSICYGPFAQFKPGGTSQLDAAVAYLEENPGEVGLITLTMGANDILACDPSDPDVAVCVTERLGELGANLQVILATLKAAAPGIPIVAMNYYNPNLAFWIVDPALAEAALALTAPFNGTLEAIYDAFGVPVADVETAFKTYRTGTRDVPLNVRAICFLTQMCERDAGEFVLSDYDPVTPGPQTDIHPSNRGHRKIAKTFIHLIEDLGLFGG